MTAFLETDALPFRLNPEIPSLPDVDAARPFTNCIEGDYSCEVKRDDPKLLDDRPPGGQLPHIWAMWLTGSRTT